jgi:hypothetical protein
MDAASDMKSMRKMRKALMESKKRAAHNAVRM